MICDRGVWLPGGMTWARPLIMDYRISLMLLKTILSSARTESRELQLLGATVRLGGWTSDGPASQASFDADGSVGAGMTNQLALNATPK